MLPLFRAVVKFCSTNRRFAYTTVERAYGYWSVHLHLLYLQNQSQNSIFQPSESLYFDNFSPGPTIAGPIVDSGSELISSTLSVDSA